MYVFFIIDMMVSKNRNKREEYKFDGKTLTIDRQVTDITMYEIMNELFGRNGWREMDWGYLIINNDKEFDDDFEIEFVREDGSSYKVYATIVEEVGSTAGEHGGWIKFYANEYGLYGYDPQYGGFETEIYPFWNEEMRNFFKGCPQEDILPTLRNLIKSGIIEDFDGWDGSGTIGKDTQILHSVSDDGRFHIERILTGLKKVGYGYDQFSEWEYYEDEDGNRYIEEWSRMADDRGSNLTKIS